MAQDRFICYTGDNYAELAEIMDGEDAVLAHERSRHTRNVIFATEAVGAMFGPHVYVRELRPGDHLRVCESGDAEEYEGEP